MQAMTSDFVDRLKASMASWYLPMKSLSITTKPVIPIPVCC